ncbi:MAG: lipid-A-disaccharide synthase [Candidatus Omnitrophota bacterium]
MAQKQILIICGEASGDLNASNLVTAIKEIDPGIIFSGVGGWRLRKAGVNIYCDIKELDSIGLFDVLRKLPKFFGLKKLILQEIKIKKPDAVILVDFSGFNLRLAKEIDKTIPLIYYTSPQVWASRAGRIKTIKEHIHKMIVLFRFEREFYKKHGIEADFVGHPLLDTVYPSVEKKEFLKELGFSESKATIALLPGSRKQEVENILPVMLEASALINKHLPGTQFVIAKSSQVDLNIYNRQTNSFKADLKTVEGRTYDCLNIARFCLVASGTATLETAIMQKPLAIIYKMSLLNYLLYRPLIKVPYIGMVNIVAEKKIIPEFIQFGADPKKISEQALKILREPSLTARMENDLLQIKSLLGEKGASKRAARIIVDFLNNPSFPK